MLPSELLTDWKRGDFIRLSPGMIIACNGDLVLAVLMARILYRSFDGTQWWAATAEEIAEDTGLSLLQVRRGLKILRGMDEKPDHPGKGMKWVATRRPDRWRSVLEYTVAGGPAHKASGLTPDVPGDVSQGAPVDVSQDRPGDGSLPYKKEEKQEEEQEEGGELILFNQHLPAAGTPLADGFDEFWSMAVKKKAPATARKAYAKAVRKVGREVVHTAWARHNRVWAAWPKGDRVYIQHPATWLNAEEWDADDPLPRGDSDSWADVADRWGAAAAMWGAAGEVVEPTYSVEQIAATLVGEN